MRQIRSIAALALTTAALLALATLEAQQVNPSLFGDLHWRNIGPPRSGYVSSPAGVPGCTGVRTVSGGLVHWKAAADRVQGSSFRVEGAP